MPENTDTAAETAAGTAAADYPLGPDLAEYFVAERRGRAVRLRMHTGGAPAVYSFGLHSAWGRVWGRVANDPECRAVVFTGTGQAWIGGFDPELGAVPFTEWPAERISDLHRDRLAMVESLVFGVDVPTVGVVNGPGLHTEIALLCDLTLCTPEAVFFDGHFSAGQVPSDGMYLALRTLIGPKRAAYRVYTGAPLDAAEALELGLVNEVVPAERIEERSWELAETIARAPRAVGRLTHALVQRHLRRLVLEDYGPAITGGMFASLADRPEQ